MSLTELLGLGKELGSRVHVLGMLPALTLGLFVLALIWSGAPGDAPDIGAIGDEAEALSGWDAGLLVLCLAVLTLLAQPLQLSLVRALEGYWGSSRVARALAAACRKRQEDRRGELREIVKPRHEEPDEREIERLGEAAAVLRRRFPSGDPLRPTSLGNALRAAESRAGERYGLDTVVMWPRLYPLLPDELRAIVDAQRDQLDTAARFCAVFLAATAIGVGLLWSHPIWLLVPAGTLLLGVGAYRGAVAAAVAYGEGIEAAFDLHRFALLRALHLPLPVDRGLEREANLELSAFLLQGKRYNPVYEHDGAG